MTRWYLDTSAALKLLVEEPESSVLAEALDVEGPTLVACLLLETELRRASHRLPALTQTAVTTLLDAVELYDVPPAVFREAGLLAGPHLRSRDALHLASAVRVEADRVLTYDLRMMAAADALGLTVLAPA